MTCLIGNGSAKIQKWSCSVQILPWNKVLRFKLDFVLLFCIQFDLNLIFFHWKMAELSGFRRYSYQGTRRQSNIPRKSIVSIATTIQPPGHSWIHMLRSMYKQTFSFCPGQCLENVTISLQQFWNIFKNWNFNRFWTVHLCDCNSQLHLLFWHLRKNQQ